MQLQKEHNTKRARKRAWNRASKHDTRQELHLGLSPDFTGELPGVCMPYQVLQPYAHLHAKCIIANFFFHVSSWWLYHHHPLLHPLALLLVYCHAPFVPTSKLCHCSPYKEKTIYRITWVIGRCNRQFSRNSLHIHGSSILVPKPRLNHLTFLPQSKTQPLRSTSSYATSTLATLVPT